MVTPGRVSQRRMASVVALSAVSPVTLCHTPTSSASSSSTVARSPASMAAKERSRTAPISSDPMAPNLGPVDGGEGPGQLGGPGVVAGADPGDAAQKVGPEVGAALPVGPLGTAGGGVVEHGPQPFVLGPGHVHPAVD